MEPEKSQVKLADVAGSENAKRDILEVIEFLKEPARFQALGARIPRGVLMMGPPGTGKTLMARAVAGEAGVPFFSISGSEFIEMFVGVGASRVRDLFRQAREAILKVHTRRMPLAADVDLARLAEITIGFSGADLANLANESALLAGRRGRADLDWACFVDARDRVMLGEARDMGLSEVQRHVVAYHEVGHALLAHLLPHADRLEKVTVLPRGLTLGITTQVPDEERVNYNESYLHDRLTVMLGGRLAESVVFSEVSSGAEEASDATRLPMRV